MRKIMNHPASPAKQFSMIKLAYCSTAWEGGDMRKVPATEPELGTYTLTQSGSHASYEPVTGVLLTVTCAFKTGICAVDGSRLNR